VTAVALVALLWLVVVVVALARWRHRRREVVRRAELQRRLDRLNRDP
jgi:hypothetical protein